MQRFAKNRIKQARRINKFDTISYYVLQSMEDLVRISTREGATVYENSAMRKARENEIMNEKLKAEISPVLPEEFKNLQSTRKEVVVNGSVYSRKISPVLEDGVRIIGYVEVYRDITLARKISDELFHANKKINEDIVLARNIQQAILPTIKDFQNISFQFKHVPSNNLSGDIFDVIQIDKHRMGMYIADVVGHGISASIMTMFIRGAIRTILSENGDLSPSEVVLELKERFGALKLDVSQYFTIIFAIIDTNEKTLTYVNAGHNATPLVFNENNMAEMRNRGRFISNIFPPLEYEERTLTLNPGDRFLFYTDGLLETMNRDGQFFGMDRLKKWIMKNPHSSRFLDKLTKDLQSFRWLEQKDDIAMLYMKIRG